MSVIRRSLIVIILLLPMWASATDTLNLVHAIGKKRVSVKIQGNGGLAGKSLHLKLTSNISSPLIIKVSPGIRFISRDDGAQDLLLLEGAVLVLEGKDTAEVDLYAACTQMSNHAPKIGEDYIVGQMSEGPLLEVAQIVSNNNFFTTTAQAAVWGMTDNYNIDNIHGSDDVNLTWDLVRVVALGQRAAVPDQQEFISRPIVNRILYSSRADVVFHAPKSTVAQLVLSDDSGAIVRRYFPQKELHPGLHIFTVGVNNILEREQNFMARLLDEQGNELARKVLSNNMPYEEVTQQTTNVDFEYIVRKSSTVSMAVYDVNDNLIQEIFTEKRMTLSKRRANFKFYHNMVNSDAFKVKITNQEGELLHEQVVQI